MSPEMDTSLCSGEFNIFKNVNFLDLEEAALHLRRRKHIEVYKMHLKGSCLWSITFVIVALSVGESVNVTNYDYDHFVYAQRWPQSVCACSEGRCRIPEEVKTWTVHGLWPTLGDSDKPTECNRSWTFEEEKILDIETQLEKYWTSLEDNGENSRISFWKHEWKKHGTCCTDLTYLDSEHKYFSIGLQLNQKYDLLSLMIFVKLFGVNLAIPPCLFVVQSIKKNECKKY
ncbi:ribonuclease Oy-like isoform X2 [Xenia sp. Carnegie-2017]|uniref:ribonuclease Oy-like isoform X2 n=1 Tax=Xenia sp. Carnegie-2017 TaxID=2897299 RepID=UPI001F03B83C|nr:ribonuclease Oy-like isoform X2 [Xenia sp. Carnegie-2017]